MKTDLIELLHKKSILHVISTPCSSILLFRNEQGHIREAEAPALTSSNLFTLKEIKTPVFHFSEPRDYFRLRFFTSEHLPIRDGWSMNDKLPREVSQTFLACNATKTENFMPIKIPAALMTEDAIKLINSAAVKNSSVSPLFNTGEPPLENFPKGLRGYFQSVIVPIAPPKAEILTSVILKNTQIMYETINSKPQPSNEKTANEQRRNRFEYGQVEASLLASGAVTQAVLIGKANAWNDAKVHAQAVQTISKAKDFFNKALETEPDDFVSLGIHGYLTDLLANNKIAQKMIISQDQDYNIRQ